MPSSCLICRRKIKKPLFFKKSVAILKCEDCNIAFQERFPEDPLQYYANASYYEAWWKDKEKDKAAVRFLKEKTANWVLDQMGSFSGSGARILEVGCAFGFFLKAARQRNYQITGLEVSEAGKEAGLNGFEVWNVPFENLDLKEGSFDVVVLIDVIEHFADPDANLSKIKHLLNKDHGILVLITPDIGSIACKIFGSKWLHWKSEHLYYYSRKGISKLLQKHGFKVAVLKNAWKATSLCYMASHSAKYGNLPPWLNEVLYRLPFSSVPVMMPSELFCIAQVQKTK